MSLHNEKTDNKAERFVERENTSASGSDLSHDVDGDKIPTYLGASGHKLIWLITLASCMGFGLFGESNATLCASRNGLS